MKKGLLKIFALSPLMLICSSCKSDINVHELQPYLFKTDTYTKLDYEFANKFYADHYDNWGGGCSAISKQIDGHRLVGRNMDLNISNKCAYIIPAETGRYKTIGLAYTFRDFSPEYNDVKKKGIDKDFGKILPFLCDDVLNECGLHIEINMRHSEFWPNGDDMFACEHTNEFSDQRVHMFQLPRLVGENCANVDDAIKYLKTLDVYSQNRYWNYCFVISDPTTSILVEFCLDNIFIMYESELAEYNKFIKEFEPDIDYEIAAIGQTNFYCNYTAYLMQNTKTGIGRYEVLQRNINNVTNKDELFSLMDRISYSWFYEDYDVCKNEHFDPRSEQIGEFKGATYEFIMDPDFEPYLKKAMNDYSTPIRNITDKQVKRDANKYWESSFTEVVDCTDKSIYIRFFEDYDCMYNITFNSIEKVNYIKS